MKVILVLTFFYILAHIRVKKIYHETLLKFNSLKCKAMIGSLLNGVASVAWTPLCS